MNCRLLRHGDVVASVIQAAIGGPPPHPQHDRAGDAVAPSVESNGTKHRAQGLTAQGVGDLPAVADPAGLRIRRMGALYRLGE